MIIKTLIVEDEADIRAYWKSLIEEEQLQGNPTYKKLELIGEADNKIKARQKIVDLKPDLLLLDIQMQNGETTFQLLEELQTSIGFQVIFITAFQKYAIQAIRFAAIDFLLKPLNKQKLDNVLKKTVDEIQLKGKLNKLEALFAHLSDPHNPKNLINIPCVNKKVIPQRLLNISYFEADEGGAKVYFADTNKSIFSIKGLRHFEIALESYQCFFRIHDKFFVNLHHVLYQEVPTKHIFLRNGRLLSLSRRRRKAFIAFYEQFQLRL